MITLIQSGSESTLLIAAIALMIGALHGLEPGHSKTMIAAYIIAIKGSAFQALLLGLSAAISHSIIVWILAYISLKFSNELIGQQLEPWFLMFSGIIMLGMALWMTRALPFWKKLHPHLHHSNHQDHNTHARMHAAQIEKSLAHGNRGSWQTIVFGFTGGLLPCPAAITVFLLCVNLGKLSLGIVLVGSFSVGLALALIGVGLITAFGANLVSARMRNSSLLHYALPLSCAFIALIGLALLGNGIAHLNH